MITDKEKINEIVANRFKKLTPEQKLNLSLNLYFSARELKKVFLIKYNPELSLEEVDKKVKEIFLYARS